MLVLPDERRERLLQGAADPHAYAVAGVQTLIAAGGDIISGCPQLGGETILMRLAKHQSRGRLAGVRVIFEAVTTGSEARNIETLLETKDDAGKTALYHAAGAYGFQDVMEELMAATGLSWIHHLPRIPASSRGAQRLINLAYARLVSSAALHHPRAPPDRPSSFPLAAHKTSHEAAAESKKALTH